MWKGILKGVSYLAKDEDGRKILATILVTFFVLLLLPILFTVYILSSPITLLKEVITNPKMLAIILEFKSEYQNIMPGSGGGLYGWPLSTDYPIDKDDPTNLFGMRLHPIWGDYRLHTGIDIQAPNGSDCFAIGAGKVIRTGDSGGWGYVIELDLGKNKTGQTLTATYCHLTPGSIKVNVGDSVTRGQQIALTGTTGTTEGGHIHFEMKEDGVYCDPLKYIGMGGDFGDLDLFYRCIEAEAGGEPYNGKIAVAQCIIYTSQRKGISLDEVITAPNQYSCVSDGNIYKVTVSDDSKKAGDEALAGKRALEEGTEYFINYKWAEVTWWHLTLKPTGKIGDHSFYASW